MEQSSQYLPEITDRVAGQAPSPWLNPRGGSSAWAGSRGEAEGMDGASERCHWTCHMPLKASAGGREALILHLPLAPFTEHTCALPTAFPTHLADGQSLLFPLLHKYFQDVQKNVGTYSECLPSERVCPCKHGCMHSHVSEIHILLCR